VSIVTKRPGPSLVLVVVLVRFFLSRPFNEGLTFNTLAKAEHEDDDENEDELRYPLSAHTS